MHEGRDASDNRDSTFTTENGTEVTYGLVWRHQRDVSLKNQRSCTDGARQRNPEIAQIEERHILQLKRVEKQIPITVH